MTREGYCSAHKPPPAERSEETKAWLWMYRTDKWRKDLRPNQLLNEPFCRECARHGYRTRATDVDHVVPHRGSWAGFCDPGNLQSLCHSCHSRKTLEEIRKNAASKTQVNR